jgi:hypothetical protein
LDQNCDKQKSLQFLEDLFLVGDGGLEPPTSSLDSDEVPNEMTHL